MATTRTQLLRTARTLRLRGLPEAAATLQLLARGAQDSDPTDPDGVVVDDSMQREQQVGDLYEAEVQQYLTWLGKELTPTFHNLLYTIRDHVKRDSNTQFPNIVLRGITESLKAYGFQALEGKTLPYHTFEKRSLPRSVAGLPKRAASSHEERKKRLVRNSDPRETAKHVRWFEAFQRQAKDLKKLGYRLTTSRSRGEVQLLYKDTDFRINLGQGFGDSWQFYVTSAELQDPKYDTLPTHDGGPSDYGAATLALKGLSSWMRRWGHEFDGPESVDEAIDCLKGLAPKLDEIRVLTHMPEVSSERT